MTPALDGSAHGGVVEHRGVSFVSGVLAVTACIAALGFRDPTHGLILVGLTSCIFAAMAWLSRGGRWLTPSGVFVLASGVFVGVASLYLQSLTQEIADMSTLRDVAIAAQLTTIFTFEVTIWCTRRWGVIWPSTSTSRRDSKIGAPPPAFLLVAFLLILASQLPWLRTFGDALFVGAGLAGVLMLVLVASTRRVRPSSPAEALLALGAIVLPLLWVRWEFSGSGRLTVAGVGIPALMAWNLLRPKLTHKLLRPLGAPGVPCLRRHQ